jgi:hypothetical protein
MGKKKAIPKQDGFSKDCLPYELVDNYIRVGKA